MLGYDGPEQPFLLESPEYSVFSPINEMMMMMLIL